MDGGGEHTVSQGDVEVTRTVEADGSKMVGELEITSTAVHTVSVEVVEEFPSDASVDSVRFKSDAAPDDRDVSADRLVVEQTVDDEPERIVYGVVFADSVEDVAVSEPVIRGVTPAAAETATDAASDDRAMGDGGSDPERDGASLSLDDPVADPNDENDFTRGGDRSGHDTGQTADADEVPSGPELDDLDDGSEAATDEPAEVDLSDPASAEETTDSDDSSADDTESTDDEGSTPGQRSMEMRLDHLSARVEEFGAYSSALENFIDEHGTVSEFFDRVEDDVADLEARVDGTNEELSAEIDDVRGNVSDLATEIEHVRDDVGSMREEIVTLTAEVRELRSMRESLAAVLAGQGAPSESVSVSTAEGADADGGAQPPTDLDDDEDDIAAAVSGIESNPSDG
ncbi:hypothetical protein BRD04_03615 [Halobacteriales archaeon QS_9_67_17]|nr:MAG: hypothetical protein BRD04_03615 [Halobacteriales archaeon QS_9_67_17]